MVREVVGVFYKVFEEDTEFADLDVMILLHSVLVEVLVEKFAMLLPLVAVTHHTEAPTPAHLAQRQQYISESNSHTRTGPRPWYCCPLSECFEDLLSKRSYVTSAEPTTMMSWPTTLRYTRSPKALALEEQ